MVEQEHHAWYCEDTTRHLQVAGCDLQLIGPHYTIADPISCWCWGWKDYGGGGGGRVVGGGGGGAVERVMQSVGTG